MSERRFAPRYPASHLAEGSSPDGQIKFQGLLRDFSATGCRLRLDSPLPLRTAIEVQCDIAGVGLWLRGEVVWATSTADGVHHGIVLTGFGSQGDALFYRLFIRRLAARRATAPSDPDHAPPPESQEAPSEP